MVLNQIRAGESVAQFARKLEMAMPDRTSHQAPKATVPGTIAELFRDLEPMGDPSQFVIEDLTLEEEEAFFTIIKEF